LIEYTTANILSILPVPSATNGVQQNGILSPILFCVYVNDLLAALSKAGIACLGNNFVIALAHTDDTVLAPPYCSNA